MMTPTTNFAHKHAQRNIVMDKINTCLATLPITDVVNVLLLDDWLGPDSAGDPATGCLFTDEIWNQLRDTANATRIRIFLPNLKAAVNEA
jgi:hypothetical protein